MQAIFTSFNPQKSRTERAQAIVEFAIVLPILMMLLVGILEAGRMVFIYAAVNNASREAARYASAYGDNGAGVAKYQDCNGITDMAKRSAFFTPLTITMAYDHGTTASTFDTCTGATDSAVVVNSGTNVDRATVTVSATYKPMVKLLPLPTRTVIATSSRTILGILELSNP